MNEKLREETLKIMSNLHSGIVALNTAADEMVKAANVLKDHPISGAMRGLARRQRIKVLEMQGQLAILSTAYAQRFGPEH